MGLWGLHQYAGPSVRRGSESMCGALRGPDGQSISGPSLDSVWDPQMPICTVNLWGPHQNVGPSATRIDKGFVGPLVHLRGPQ